MIEAMKLLDITNEWIVEMPAGPLMDSMLANDVMGWETGPMYRANEALARLHFFDRKTKTMYLPEQWQPSVSVEQAMDVVEKIRGWKFPSRGWQDPDYCRPYFCIEAPNPHAGEPARTILDRERQFPGLWVAGWKAGFVYEGDDWMDKMVASADTAPLAICRAALMGRKANPAGLCESKPPLAGS